MGANPAKFVSGASDLCQGLERASRGYAKLCNCDLVTIEADHSYLEVQEGRGRDWC